MATTKEIQKYVDLPWSYTIEREDGDFIVYVNELPGICTDNKNIAVAMKDIKEVIYATIELYLKQGKEIPIPINKKKYKGKIAYRTSANRHYKISRLARQKHQSISKLIDTLVDVGINQIH